MIGNNQYKIFCQIDGWERGYLALGVKQMTSGA
jgi:hypothetical protein